MGGGGRGAGWGEGAVRAPGESLTSPGTCFEGKPVWRTSRSVIPVRKIKESDWPQLQLSFQGVLCFAAVENSVYRLHCCFLSWP